MFVPFVGVVVGRVPEVGDVGGRVLVPPAGVVGLEIGAGAGFETGPAVGLDTGPGDGRETGAEGLDTGAADLGAGDEGLALGAAGWLFGRWLLLVLLLLPLAGIPILTNPATINATELYLIALQRNDVIMITSLFFVVHCSLSSPNCTPQRNVYSVTLDK